MSRFSLSHRRRTQHTHIRTATIYAEYRKAPGVPDVNMFAVGIIQTLANGIEFAFVDLPRRPPVVRRSFVRFGNEFYECAGWLMHVIEKCAIVATCGIYFAAVRIVEKCATRAFVSVLVLYTCKLRRAHNLRESDCCSMQLSKGVPVMLGGARIVEHT